MEMTNNERHEAQNRKKYSKKYSKIKRDCAKRKARNKVRFRK